MALVHLTGIATDLHREAAPALERGHAPGSPRPFDHAYGFRPSGRKLDDEAILRLDLPREDR